LCGFLDAGEFNPPKLDDDSYSCEPLDFPSEEYRPETEVDSVIRLPPAAQFYEPKSTSNTTIGASAITSTTSAYIAHLPVQIPTCVQEMSDDGKYSRLDVAGENSIHANIGACDLVICR
jgi:hypothetical protein